MSETEPRSIAAVGDPDQPLSVATVVLAAMRIRLLGARGPFEYRLHVEQANDIETALMAGPPTGVTFRGLPVVTSGLWEGRIVSVEDGVCVDILSSRRPTNAAEWAAWMKPGAPTDRQRDPRARNMSPEQVASLKAEAEANRRACMTDVERLTERVDALEATVRTLLRDRALPFGL